MTQEELSNILLKHNALIEAPAGHGKTEMIVELVRASEGKQLLLTHTNAGVNALTTRLKKYGISSNQYFISTIAGFCMRWCSAYPATAKFGDLLFGSDDYYQRCYTGAAEIFAHEWARNVIRRTYSGVIVDEYQDCIVEQHQIFLNLNQSVPVYVLGDPMQAIFGWAGTLVSWENIEFEPVCVQTRPWRWKDTNPNLGEYLNIMRERLRPALQGKQVTISVNNYQNSVFVVSPSQSINWKTRYVDGRFIKKLEKYHHVLYISSDPKFQIELCTRTAGKFQNDEPQECRELFNTAKDLDSNDIQKISQALYRFLTICATGIKAKLGSYWKHIEAGDFNFQRIKKFPRFAELVMELKANPTIDNILNILTWVRKNGSFPIYRRELFYELERALRYARDTSSSLMEAVQRIRSVLSLRKTYSFQFLSSRTTLSKGLEFDCVIIDLTQKYPLCVTDYYVALTRATKAVYLITDKNTVIFKK